MLKKLAVSLSMASLMILGSLSATSFAQPLFTLDGAVRYALENNDELRAMGFSLAAGNEDIAIAQSNLAPKLRFEERVMRTDNPGYVLSIKMDQHRFSARDLAGAPQTFNEPGPINDLQSSFSIEQPLFAPKADLGIVMAKKEYEAQTSDYRGKRQEVALKVTQAYLAVLTASQYVRTGEQNLEDANEHLRIADSRYRAGLGLYSDTLRSATAVSEAQQRLVSANKNWTVAKRQLGLVLGLDGSAEVADDPQVLPSVKALDYYNTAALTRPDIISLEFRYQNAKNNISLAKAGYLPSLGVAAGYQANDSAKVIGSSGDSWQITAFLRWDIFDGNKTASETKKANLKLQETALILQGLKRAVSLKVFSSYQSIDEAAKNVELAKSAVVSAEEGKRLVEMRYRASLSPLVDLLDAQVNLANARANLVAQSNGYLLAVAALDFESGTILKTLAIE